MVLGNSEIQRFHREGYLPPFRIFSREKAKEYYKIIDGEILTDEPSPVPYNDLPQFNRHVDSPTVYEICTQDGIVARMRDIYGENLMLWGSRFWDKKPGAPVVPWHQHYHHTLVDPPLTLTAWIALTDSDPENGALQLLPGTHDQVLPEVAAPEDTAFPKMADPDEFEVDDPVTMKMEAGECLIFDERTLHRSFENTSNRRRLALSMRVSVPFANYDSSVFGEEDDDEFSTAMMIHGENNFEKNTTISPPESKTSTE